MIHLSIASGVSAPVKCNLQDGDYAIGRGEGAKIRLREPAISERHALLRVSGSTAEVEDLGSSNGTEVNGEAIAPSAPHRLGDGDTIKIGSYKITVTGLAPAQPSPDSAPILTRGLSPAQSSSGPAQPSPDSAPILMRGLSPAQSSSGPAQPSPDSAPILMRGLSPAQSPLSPAQPSHPSDAAALQNARVRRDIKNQIHRELVERLELKRLSASRVGGDELSRRAREKLDAIISEIRAKLPTGINPAELADEIFNEAMRLGPLEDFLADDSISEIMVNGPNKVYVERRGKLELTQQTFLDDASVLAIIERIVSPIGRRIDESQPYVDARLPDGSRVNAIIPPLSLTGPCITIRKFSRTPLTAEDFVRFGTWTPDIASFLDVCVKMRKNIIVAGGTGSGKTTLLNLLGTFIPHSERIVTIEDAAELRLVQPHLVRLESRPPNIEGKGAVTIRDLVRNALRMRPDRIIVGECRGGEALDMLQAMNTGHDGSLTTVHANSPRDVVSRLETMVLMSGMDLPSRAIREQISSAVDLIVHEARFADGTRRITHVTEVMGLEGSQTVMQDIFEFRQTGVSPDGRVQGYLTATGAVPSFFEQLKMRGLELPPSIFTPADAAGNGGPQ